MIWSLIELTPQTRRNGELSQPGRQVLLSPGLPRPPTRLGRKEPRIVLETNHQSPDSPKYGQNRVKVKGEFYIIYCAFVVAKSFGQP
jgi:hypothetical protein